METKKGIRHKFMYNLMLRTLQYLNFDEATHEMIKTIMCRLGLEPPEISDKALQERLSQVSFIKEISGYLVWVRTSFNSDKKRFMYSGQVWIMITKPTSQGEKRLYTTFFYRRGNFAQKFSSVLEFVVHALQERRPLDSRNKYMELKEISPGNYKWCSTVNKEKKDFFFSIPKNVRSFILKRQNEKKYYEKIIRPNKGITSRKRNLRKKWKVRHPQNAL